MIIYKLSENQHNYLKKQIFIIINWEITEMIKKNQVIYEIKYLKKILQNLHQKKEKWKTIFWTKYELYEYQIILFELTNMSATFQKLINYVLYNHLNEFVIAYLNNILIYFENEKNHEKHVKKILKRFQEKKFYLKSEKYEFHKQWIKYLKYIVTMKKLEMNSEKIKIMIRFFMLKCVKNIQVFQKLTEYYWKFIMNFVNITVLLIDLLRKNRSFK